MQYDINGARKDFDRGLRRHALAELRTRFRREPDDALDMLPLDDVVAALGMRSQTDLGIQTIPLDSIIGTVGRSSEFDRAFRPASRKLRSRWLGVATSRRSGKDMPPIDVYRVNGLHFVEDGHHRVSVALAMGDTTIEAHVREVRTELGAAPDLRVSQLTLKHHERLFQERVPLPPAEQAQIVLTDEWRYAQLAALIEARGYRESHAQGRLIPRAELALTWFREQYQPVVAELRERGVGGPGTDTDRYLRFVLLRFLLLHTHEWSDGAIDRLVAEIRPPSPTDDTLVHQILTEMQERPAPPRRQSGRD
jgi:hypothetical protein